MSTGIGTGVRKKRKMQHADAKKINSNIIEQTNIWSTNQILKHKLKCFFINTTPWFSLSNIVFVTYKSFVITIFFLFSSSTIYLAAHTLQMVVYFKLNMLQKQWKIVGRILEFEKFFHFFIRTNSFLQYRCWNSLQGRSSFRSRKTHPFKIARGRFKSQNFYFRSSHWNGNDEINQNETWSKNPKKKSTH